MYRLSENDMITKKDAIAIGHAVVAACETHDRFLENTCSRILESLWHDTFPYRTKMFFDCNYENFKKIVWSKDKRF